MKSNPEEFLSIPLHATNSNKWDWITQRIQSRVQTGDKNATDFLTKGEVDALYKAYQAILRDDFTKRVMQTILYETEGEDGDKPQSLGLLKEGVAKMYEDPAAMTSNKTWKQKINDSF